MNDFNDNKGISSSYDPFSSLNVDFLTHLGHHSNKPNPQELTGCLHSLLKEQQFNCLPKVESKHISSNCISAVNQSCIPMDLYFSPTLLQHCVQLKQNSFLDVTLRALCDEFHGILKPHKGCFKAVLYDNTRIKVKSYRDTQSSAVFIEFNYVEGSPFTFQKFMSFSKLLIASYIVSEGSQQSVQHSLEDELKRLDAKEKFWMGCTDVNEHKLDF